VHNCCTQHSTERTTFPLILGTIIIAQTLSTARQDELIVAQQFRRSSVADRTALSWCLWTQEHPSQLCTRTSSHLVTGFAAGGRHRRKFKRTIFCVKFNLDLRNGGRTKKNQKVKFWVNDSFPASNPAGKTSNFLASRQHPHPTILATVTDDVHHPSHACIFYLCKSHLWFGWSVWVPENVGKCIHHAVNCF